MSKRRANGEGNLRKRSDGRWEGRYTAGYDPDTGKRIIKNVLGRTQAEAKEKLKAAVEQAQQVDITRTDEYTVATWLRAWYDLYAQPNIRQATADRYKLMIETYTIPRIGKLKLKKLTSRDLQKMYKNLMEHGRVNTKSGHGNPGLSSTTVRSVYLMLHSAFERAVKERLIPRNPTDDCIAPKVQKVEMKTLLPEHLKSYLDAANARGVLPMFYLELTTGIRRGELVALLWTDLDLESQTLSISKSAGRINGEVKVTQPKTANSVRTIFLPKETVDLLIQEHAKHPTNPIMFPSPVTGKLYGPDCIGRLHKNLLRKAGITENIPFHGLRHTFATLAIQQGVDAKTVSTILGHYSAGFTLDTYTHVTNEMQREAAQRMGSFMAQTV